MSLGRRKVGIEDATRWVFNRMADVYDARPPYPAALIDALVDLAEPVGRRVADVGAGTGHLALPLAARGADVVAIEPALAMLDRLRAAARDRGLDLSAVHAAAEALPLPPRSVDLAIVSDALHFMDAELTARQIARVLVPGGALALVRCDFGDTPFMRDLLGVIEDSVPRRPRALTQSIVHLSALSGAALTGVRSFHDETPVDHPTLERILRSISFIGPAMNPQRFAAFRARVFALTTRPVWARTFTLRSGYRKTGIYDGSPGARRDRPGPRANPIAGSLSGPRSERAGRV
jgi:ubiquinone/menaquinone biosynthesis C-methylase UbiE